MPDPLLYLKAMGFSALVSGMIVLAIAGLRRPKTSAWDHWACVLAVGIGLTVGYDVLGFEAVWPPANGLSRLLCIIVPTTLLIEMISGTAELPDWISWFLRTGLALATPRILLHGSIYLTAVNEGWDNWSASASMCVSGILLAGVWVLIHTLSRGSGWVSLDLVLAMTTLVAGLMLMMSGYLKGGAAAFPLVATVISTSVGRALSTRAIGGTGQSGSRVIMGIGIVGLFGLLFIGRFFGRLTTGCSVILLLVPLLCWVTEVPALRGWNPRLRGLLRLVLVAIPLAVMLFLAKREFDRNLGSLL